MFLTRLVADMVLRLSDEVADDCAAEMENGFVVTPVSDRCLLWYVLTSVLVLDYIHAIGSKKGEPLHELLITRLGKLGQAFAGEPLTYDQLCKYYDRGVIPVFSLNIFPYEIDEPTLYELPKGRVGNLVTMLQSFQTEVLDGSSGDSVVKLFGKAIEMLTQAADIWRDNRLVDGKLVRLSSTQGQVSLLEPEDSGSCEGGRRFDLD